MAVHYFLRDNGLDDGLICDREEMLESPDLHATLLHCLGLDQERLTYRHQGRDFRLTDVDGRVVHKLLV